MAEHEGDHSARELQAKELKALLDSNATLIHALRDLGAARKDGGPSQIERQIYEAAMNRLSIAASHLPPKALMPPGEERSKFVVNTAHDLGLIPFAEDILPKVEDPLEIVSVLRPELVAAAMGLSQQPPAFHSQQQQQLQQLQQQQRQQLLRQQHLQQQQQLLAQQSRQSSAGLPQQLQLGMLSNPNLMLGNSNLAAVQMGSSGMMWQTDAALTGKPGQFANLLNQSVTAQQHQQQLLQQQQQMRQLQLMQQQQQQLQQQQQQQQPFQQNPHLLQQQHMLHQQQQQRMGQQQPLLQHQQLLYMQQQQQQAQQAQQAQHQLKR